MINAHFKLAYESIRSTKWRSFFTMLGIIIGVVSVVTIVSLGEGVKQQIEGQIDQIGSDLIIVRPGNSVKRDAQGNIISVDFFSLYNKAATLSDDDIEAVSNASDISSVAPLSFVSGNPSYDNKEYIGGSVVATSNTFLDLINHEVEFGSFLSENDEGKNFAVIGTNVAQDLFGDNVPIGRSLQFRGQSFAVKGVMAEFDENPLNLGANYNNTIFIPYVTGKSLNDGAAQVFQIIAKPNNPKLVENAEQQINANLMKVHDDDNDFTVLKQEDTLDVADSVLRSLTALVAAIASISLIVGGIGVMNIMIVNVVERTSEIGIRKAVGATNQQILIQFLSEAILLSVIGGFLGLFFSLLVNFGIRIFTDLAPVITLPIVVIAMLMSTVVGVFFGVVPALQAARKNPIDALRNQ